MRILLLNYEYPPLGGGAGNATAQIAKEMAAVGHDVFVMTARFADLPHQETIDGYTVIRIPSRRQAKDRSNVLEMLSFLLSSLWAVIQWRRTINADHCIAFFGIPGAPAAWVQKALFGVPYIVSLRGGDVPGFQPYDLKFFHTITKPILQFLWWQSAGVVANSDGLAALAQQSAPKRDIPVISNGVDTDVFYPAEENEENSVGSKFMFAGRISQQKGLTYLIQAVASLPPEQRQKIDCITIVGDGPLRPALQNEIDAHQLTDIFQFIGWKYRDELPPIYQAHSAFVLPSLDEGMPNVLLEAMACGLPIIATEIAGNIELVDDNNGWLVPPQNVEKLAHALQQSINDGASLSAKGESSRQKALAYSWENVAQGYLNLMQVQKEDA